MQSKLRFLDPIIVIGTIISLALAIILVLIGQDEVLSLLIGLVIACITLLIDIIARLKESEEKIIQITELGSILIKNPPLLTTVSQIADDYETVNELGVGFFVEAADLALFEARDVVHKLSEGRMTHNNLALGRPRMLYGNRPESSIKVSNYSNPSFYRTDYGKSVLAKNSSAINRGVEFTYIWIQERETLFEFQDVVKQQIEMGIKSLYVFPSEIPPTLLEHYRIKDDNMLFK